MRMRIKEEKREVAMIKKSKSTARTSKAKKFSALADHLPALLIKG